MFTEHWSSLTHLSSSPGVTLSHSSSQPFSDVAVSPETEEESRSRYLINMTPLYSPVLKIITIPHHKTFSSCACLQMISWRAIALWNNIEQEKVSEFNSFMQLDQEELNKNQAETFKNQWWQIKRYERRIFIKQSVMKRSLIQHIISSMRAEICSQQSCQHYSSRVSMLQLWPF